MVLLLDFLELMQVINKMHTNFPPSSIHKNTDILHLLYKYPPSQ